MAQKQRTARRTQSDFPIFEYLEMVMPTRIINHFRELPPHYRWLIISIIASAVVLWAFLTIVVGGLKHYVATRGEFLYDALYLPYGLEARSLPVVPEVMDDSVPFFVLPQAIGGNYVLQIPLSEEEAEVAAKAETEAFLSLSAPAQVALMNLQGTLNEALAERTAQAEAAATEAEADVLAPVDGAAAVVPTAIVTAMPTIAATVDTLPIQSAAVNALVLELTTLNQQIADSESIEPVYAKRPVLQQAISDLAAAGAVLPELDALNLRLAELAALDRPEYVINDCLASSEFSADRDAGFAPVCTIENTATFVERGAYAGNGVALNVTAAQYLTHEAATSAVKSLFYRGRLDGTMGNFSMDTIEYDYFYNLSKGLYTFAWSHENWVYSITAPSQQVLEEVVKIFPY